MWAWIIHRKAHFWVTYEFLGILKLSFGQYYQCYLQGVSTAVAATPSGMPLATSTVATCCHCCSRR